MREMCEREREEKACSLSPPEREKIDDASFDDVEKRAPRREKNGFVFLPFFAFHAFYVFLISYVHVRGPSP